jgi:hypothetical protein
MMWSLSPDPPITPVRAWMRLVNRVDKPQRLTQGAPVRCSTCPVTEMEPVVDESVILTSCSDQLHPSHVRGLGKGQTSLHNEVIGPITVFRDCEVFSEPITS